jgi:hypothetical protein
VKTLKIGQRQVGSKKMNSKQWYEELFKNFARHYDPELFTQGTAGLCGDGS